MIRRLRLKFVALSMTLVTAVLAVVFCVGYAVTGRTIQNLSLQVLQRVIQEPLTGQPPGEAPDVSIFIGGDRVLLPYFTVELWPSSGGYTAYVTGGTYAGLEDTDTLADILSECMAQSSGEGSVTSYGLRYLRQDNGLYEKLAFVDLSMERAMLGRVARSYLLIAFASFLLLLGVSVLLSRWATAPVEKAWRQQRRFLSDASHELKTPLTVILSNAELLESAPLEERPARWADNIHSEARQMKSLVEEMLTLARAEDMAPAAAPETVSLSDVVTDCALAFEAVAFEAGKSLDYQIADEVTVPGAPDKLRRLTSILLDNAVKYGAEGAAIRLRLTKTDRQAILSVSNTGSPIPAEQLPHLFERFYRADDSRGEKSGFGLGLAIAKAITEEHKGSIRAESTADETRFLCTLPLKRP